MPDSEEDYEVPEEVESVIGAWPLLSCLVGREGLWLQLAPRRRVGCAALFPLPVSRGSTQPSSPFREHVAARRLAVACPPGVGIHPDGWPLGPRL